jgi:hypothetical protein
VGDGGSKTSDAARGIKPVLTPPSGIPTIVPKVNPALAVGVHEAIPYDDDDDDSSVRSRMPTITDEDALENARLQSLPSNLPPPRRPMSTIPGALVDASRNPRDSSVEIDTGEEDLESLDDAQQIALLSARLAPLNRVPSLATELSELGALLQDPKTAYVLGFIDGILPLETIIEVTGLPELETLRVLDRMIGQSIVVVRGR